MYLYLVKHFKQRGTLLCAGSSTFIFCTSYSIQIISFGAGFDTSYFRLFAEGKLDHCKYFEVHELLLVDKQNEYHKIFIKFVAYIAAQFLLAALWVYLGSLATFDYCSVWMLKMF